MLAKSGPMAPSVHLSSPEDYAVSGNAQGVGQFLHFVLLPIFHILKTHYPYGHVTIL